MELLKLNQKLKIALEKYSLDELIIIGLTVSILLSVYFTIAATVLTLTYLIVRRKIIVILKSIKGAYFCCCILPFKFFCVFILPKPNRYTHCCRYATHVHYGHVRPYGHDAYAV